MHRPRSIAITALVLLGASASAHAALSVPLTVQDFAGVARAAHPVRAGVPIPRSEGLLTTNMLRLLDGSGTMVPARFLVTGRWDAGPADTAAAIRWILVDFTATVPANGSATYTLDDGGPGMMPTGLLVNDGPTVVDIYTGPARFQVPKGSGAILGGAWLDLDGDGNFSSGEQALAAAADTGAFVTAGAVEYRSMAEPPISVAVVEGGPGRATVRIEGFHRNGSTRLLRYVTHLTFFAGQSYVHAQHGIVEGRVAGSGNGGLPGGITETPIGRAGLRFRLALAGTATARVAGDAPAPRTFALAGASATAAVRQRPTTDWQVPLSYQILQNGSPVETGQRAREAWLDLGDARWGLLVTTRDFWRKCPERLLAAGDGTVSVELPSEPYTIYQGMTYMEDVLLALHPASTPASTLRELAQGIVKDPLFAVAPPSWYAGSGALGELRIAPSTRYPAYEQAMDDAFDATTAWIDQGHAFGLMNWLDMPIDRYAADPDPHQIGWGNSYYDPAGAQIREFARRGDYRFLRDLAIPMVRHFYSVDMNDTDDPSWYVNGISGSRGERHRGAWTGEYHYGESLWDYYYLTGDRRALERGLAAARTYANAPAWENDYDLGTGYPGISTRMMAQKLHTLLEGFLASGDPSLRAALVADAEDMLAVWGTPEHFFRGSREQIDPYATDQAFMGTLLYLPVLWEYHRLTGSPAAYAKLTTTPRRWLTDFRLSQVPTSPDYRRFFNMVEVTTLGGGSYTVSGLTPTGTSDDYMYDGGVHGLVAAAARAASLTGDAAMLLEARDLYEQRILPGWFGAIWDKPASQDTLRAAVALALLDPATAPVGDQVVAGRGHGAASPNQVRILDGAGTVLRDFYPYASGAWGVNVATGDVDGALPEVLTGPGPGAVFGPQARAFRRDATPLAKVNFYAYGTLRYGVNVASERLDSDAFREIATGAGPGAVFGPHLRGFDYDGLAVAAMAKVSFFAYGTLKFGVNPAAGDVDGDGFGEILTGPGPGVIFGPQVRGFDYDGAGVTAISKINFDAFGTPQYGAVVAGGGVDPDAYAEILASPGPGAGASFPGRYRGFTYDASAVTALPGFDVVAFPGRAYGGRPGAGDVDGAGVQELVAGAGPDPAADATVRPFRYDGAALAPLPSFPAFPAAAHGVSATATDLGY